MPVPSDGALPDLPDVVAQRWPQATAGLLAYAGLLAGPGVTRGLVGPREVPRLWERHLLNCAVVAEVVPEGSGVVDIGSGAGLPGLVLALVRPDLTVRLVEPLERRSVFLTEAVELLEVGARVQVVRDRAETLAAAGPVADVVTARAVAPLDRLAGWCLPLVVQGGRLVALKGERAEAEVAVAAEVLAAWGAPHAEVVSCGVGVVDPPTRVVVAERTSLRSPSSRARPRRRRP